MTECPCAAGPWEPYSDETYERLRDKNGAVWAAWWHDGPIYQGWGYAAAIRRMDALWQTECPDESRRMPRNPDRIARIIPPQEAAADADSD